MYGAVCYLLCLNFWLLWLWFLSNMLELSERFATRNIARLNRLRHISSIICDKFGGVNQYCFTQNDFAIDSNFIHCRFQSTRKPVIARKAPLFTRSVLTQLDMMTHMYLWIVIVGSSNWLLPVRCQTITCVNKVSLSMGPLGIPTSYIWAKKHVSTRTY